MGGLNGVWGVGRLSDLLVFKVKLAVFTHPNICWAFTIF